MLHNFICKVSLPFVYVSVTSLNPRPYLYVTFHHQSSDIFVTSTRSDLQTWKPCRLLTYRMESIWILDLDSSTLKVSKWFFSIFSTLLNLFIDAKMTDGFPEELRSVLHPHWEQFPPQHPLIPYFFGVFLFALSFISLVGNFLLLYVFLSTKDLRTPVRLST